MLLIITKGKKMMTSKQQAIDALNFLPDKAEMNEIMYRLYVVDKIQ